MRQQQFFEIMLKLVVDELRCANMDRNKENKRKRAVEIAENIKRGKRIKSISYSYDNKYGFFHSNYRVGRELPVEFSSYPPQPEGIITKIVAVFDDPAEHLMHDYFTIYVGNSIGAKIDIAAQIGYF